MKNTTIVTVLAFLLGCSSRQAPQEVILHADGSATFNGASASDARLRELAIGAYRKHGTFPLTIRAEGTVPLGRLTRVADGFRYVGVWQIHTGPARQDAPALLYPTFQTWTNQWKWHGLFAECNLNVSIQTNAGVNVRLLRDGALLNSSAETMQSLLSHLAALSGTDRARVVITSDTNAPHSSLMAVLKACQTHALDPLFVEHREAEQAESTDQRKAGRARRRLSGDSQRSP